MSYRLKALLIASFAACLAALAACGEDSSFARSAVPAVPSGVQSGLPPLPGPGAPFVGPRESSFLQLEPTVYSSSPTGIDTAVPDAVLGFDAPDGGLVFAVLRYDAQGDNPVQLQFELSGVTALPSTHCWLGLSDYGSGAWDIVPLPGSGLYNYALPGNFNSAGDGASYVVFIAYDGIAGTLRKLDMTTDGTIPTYTIGGFVGTGIVGTPGVTVTLTQDATEVGTDVTDATGLYSISALLAGDYTVTPTPPAGFSAAPPSIDVALSADSPDNDFELTAVPTYTISGTVTDTDASGPAAGATLWLHKDFIKIDETVSGVDGTYSFSGLGDGNYFVLPIQGGFDFDPFGQSPIVDGADVTGQDFNRSASAVPLYNIFGKILDGSGPVAGLELQLSGDSAGSATTDANGTYIFQGLNNGSYTVTPASSGYLYDPLSHSVSIAGADSMDNDFAATKLYILSGTITDGVSGVPDVPVSLERNSVFAGSTVTDAQGDYSFADLDPATYTVTPAEGGFVFAPPGIVRVISNADSSGNDFVRSEVHDEPGIYGTITEDGLPVNAATVYLIRINASGAIVLTTSTVTDVLGKYAFTGLSASQYRIIPQLNMFGFTPSMDIVDFTDTDVLVEDFTAVSFDAVPASVNYDDHMRPLLFSAICMNCHDSSKSGVQRNGAPSFVNWDTYGGTTEPTKDFGNTRVHNDSMPPFILGFKTTQFQKDLFQAWKDGGYAEN